MLRETRVRLLVAAMSLSALMASGFAWGHRGEFPGIWVLVSFTLVAFLLEGLANNLRVSARGSTAFIIHLAAAMLFGGFWSGLLTGASTLFAEVARGNTVQKTLFNVAQRVVSVVVAVAVYEGLGGGLPPAYLTLNGVLQSEALQRDLGLFFVFALIYFLINSVAVSVAVAFSTEKSIREVWNLNTRGILGYDLGASIGAILVAWVYAKLQTQGYGPIGLVVVVVPLVVVRHVYGMFRQLQDSGQELLQLMVKAIEARDPYTSGHSLRVRELSRAIALELGLSSQEVEHIETAALLHDVGKIHEEFAPLLRKESRLTSEETALMQTHATKSAELVGIISKFRGPIQDAVQHHHERWDGEGYPNGLAAKEIPLGSRIILISDTIDAMTTDRPYRKRLGLDIVIAELQKCKGTQFDPDLVNVVISSVAVRRLIGSPLSHEMSDIAPGRSKRVSWPAASLWKTRRG